MITKWLLALRSESESATVRRSGICVARTVRALYVSLPTAFSSSLSLPAAFSSSLSLPTAFSSSLSLPTAFSSSLSLPTAFSSSLSLSTVFSSSLSHHLDITILVDWA